MLKNTTLGRLTAARILTLLFLIALSPLLAGAAKAENLIDVFGAWTAFAGGDGKARICYMGAVPEKEEGNYTRRDPTYVFVTHRPASKERNVVEVHAGYTYRANSKVDVKIDKLSFSLLTDQGSAWTSDSKTDAKLVEAMRRGKTMTVIGVSSRGTKTTDTYSLAGVSAAHNAINKACAAN